ncbi:DMT family transporter [Frigidibacter sp. MR17.14]|uniref:DMT family transporter n=1 Tax=Frigidibacter sp. MR17.14 TaxID=3126509 RepID=UPI003012E4FE
MVLGLVLFTLMDALAKHLGERYPALQVVWARYAGQTGMLLILLAPRLRTALRSAVPGLQALRSLCQFGSTAIFFLSLTYLGLAEATAIFDVNPVLITLGAALFLGERLGPRRIAGIVAALVGAMIIIRPGSGVFAPASLLPLAGACCYAAFALVTRKVGTRDPLWTSLLYTGLVGTLVSTAVLPWIWVPIEMDDLPGFLVIGLIGAAGQLFVIRAFSITEASALAPFGYCSLILATFWGWMFWGRLPDGWTLVGMVVIAGAGLYVWHRETRTRPTASADGGV